MSGRFDTALIDIDGTLLDSTYHHALAWSRAFAECGEDVPVWLVHRHIGMGGDRLVPAVTDEHTEKRIGDEVRERWERAFDEVVGQTRLFPGARDLLVALRGAGLKVVLASSSIPRHAAHALELLDAEQHADAWTTSEDAEESKPDPELLDKALARVSGRRAVMIGDATWDAIAATQRGIPTIGLRCGGFGVAELIEAGAVAVYDDPQALAVDLDGALATAAEAVAH